VSVICDSDSREEPVVPDEELARRGARRRRCSGLGGACGSSVRAAFFSIFCLLGGSARIENGRISDAAEVRSGPAWRMRGEAGFPQRVTVPRFRRTPNGGVRT